LKTIGCLRRFLICTLVIGVAAVLFVPMVHGGTVEQSTPVNKEIPTLHPSAGIELAVAVYDAGYAAGMSFPFPQCEVRLLRDPDAGEDSSVLKGGKT
jgi:hypothetical protein